MPNLSTSASAAVTHYSNRATGYDEGNGGWHVDLGLDFVRWLEPKPGDVALDLACGTGLVAIPLGEAMGPRGQVVAVDITAAMLDEARKKPLKPSTAPVSWHEHYITDLSGIKDIDDVVDNYGGFDIISCCSALVLLSDPQAAIKAWSELLRPGGKLIVDTPTEDKSLLHLFTQEMRQSAHLPNEFNWQWIKGPHSLEDMLETAGLHVSKTWTRKTMDEKVYEAEEVDEVFNENVQKYQDFMKASNLEELRTICHKHWQESLDEEGKYRDAAKLYVTLGIKLES